MCPPYLSTNPPVLQPPPQQQQQKQQQQESQQQRPKLLKNKQKTNYVKKIRKKIKDSFQKEHRQQTKSKLVPVKPVPFQPCEQRVKNVMVKTLFIKINSSLRGNVEWQCFSTL